METKCIVSLTSHTKSRLAKLPKYLFQSLLKFNDKKFKIVLTLFKDDVQYITSEMKLLIDNGLVELIVADNNLKSHLKYFYAMKKYKDLPIITIDDDKIYPYKMFNYMLEEHYKRPNLVLCRSCQEFTFTNNKINPTEKWLKSPQHDISPKNHAEGYAGILYPADCLHISDDIIPDIEKTIKSDDIFLSILEIRNKIQVYYLPKMRHEFVLSTKGEDSISLIPDIVKINNGYVSEFSHIFNEVANVE